MKKVIIVSSPSTQFEIVHEKSIYAKEDMVYFVPKGIGLENMIEVSKYNELLKRYTYLEKARSWIIKNIKGMKRAR